jgi:hypothetical protein
MEAAVVLNHEWKPIAFHTPEGRTVGSLPDSQSLWETLWENRKALLGVAHSHPGGGIPGPSHTDVTTFSAIERGLGVGRLLWPIVTADAVRVFSWHGPGLHDYKTKDLVVTVDMLSAWVPELLQRSE